MASRNPVPCLTKLTINNVTSYKRVDCKFYEQCLEGASEDNWPQFHCRKCKAYEKDPTPLDLGKLSKALDEE